MPDILRQACLRQAALVFDDEYDLHNWAKIEYMLRPSYLRSFRFQFFDDAAAALHWLTGSDVVVRRLQAEWKAVVGPAAPAAP